MALFNIFVFIVLYLLHFDNVQGRKGFGSGEQDWSYVEVRPGAHMFWWLYYTSNVNVSAYYERPLIIWLQGGPGASSSGDGNFFEIGPLDLHLRPRNHSWVKDYNILFIDNPVGTGFSYVDNDAAYARTNAQIATDLLNCMRDFYKRLPEFRKVPVYIASESYGGKMAAEFALLWYKAQNSNSIKSNLKGVSLGDPWISPIDTVLGYAPFLYQTGFVDSEGYKIIEKAANKTRDSINAGFWSMATDYWRYTERLIFKLTDGIDFYNIMTKQRSREQMMNYTDDRDSPLFYKLMNTYVKNSLNLNAHWYPISDNVFNKLKEDFMKPVTNVVDQLLDETNLRVVVYTGQLDLVVDTPGTLKWIESLESRIMKNWRNVPRLPLIFNGFIEGYKKICKNFAFYWVNRAGHMVPIDNPVASALIIKDLINENST